MSPPRIFVSHSHKDDQFTQRLVADLHGAGADVWVDKVGILHSAFLQRIDEALEQCEWLVLVLTQNAIASQQVNDEVDAALHRVNQGHMRGIIAVLAAPCESDTIPAQWAVLQRFDATGNYQTALAGVLYLVGLLPQLSSVEDLIAEGHALGEQGRHAESLRLYERATQLAPDSVDAWLGLGFEHFELDNHEEALTAAERALRTEPDNPSAWSLRCTALSFLERREEALAALDCTIALDPERTGFTASLSWSFRATLLIGLQRYEEALVSCNQALALSQENDMARRNKGNALCSLQRYDEAVAAYDQAVALYPEGPDIWSDKANALRALGREAEAQEAERRARELDG